MPCYEWQCPACGHVKETFPARAQDAVAPSCQHGAALVPMARVQSTPRPHMLTGADEKARRGRMISKHNVDYWNSRKGREQYVDDKSGRPDLTQLETR